MRRETPPTEPRLAKKPSARAGVADHPLRNQPVPDPALELFRSFAKLCRQLEQCFSRVDCRGLPWEPQTVFGTLPTFFRRGHDDNPTCEPHQAPYRSGPTAPSCLIVSDSVLDNAQHAEEARTIAEKLSDPQSRRTMLRISENYERLAVRAER